MSRAARTLQLFSLYLLVLGPALILVPDRFLPLFGLPAPQEIWVRVVGVTALNIGVYYWYAARCEARAFFHASLYTRGFVFLSFTAFALLGLAPPVLILFGLADLAGALWTAWALRRDARRPGPA